MPNYGLWTERYAINTDVKCEHDADAHTEAPAQRIRLCVSFAQNFTNSQAWRCHISYSLSLSPTHTRILVRVHGIGLCESNEEKPKVSKKIGKLNSFRRKCAKFPKWFNTNLCPKTLRTLKRFCLFTKNVCNYLFDAMNEQTNQWTRSVFAHANAPKWTTWGARERERAREAEIIASSAWTHGAKLFSLKKVALLPSNHVAVRMWCDAVEDFKRF